MDFSSDPGGEVGGASDYSYRSCTTDCEGWRTPTSSLAPPTATLQPTALVHEAYLRLARGTGHWRSKTPTSFAVAALQMRNVLVDHARAAGAQKRRGERVTLKDGHGLVADHRLDVLAVDEALTLLGRHSERQERVAELRLFAGMTVAEIVAVLGVSERTVKYDWRHARAWLTRQLRDPQRRANGEPRPIPDPRFGFPSRSFPCTFWPSNPGDLNMAEIGSRRSKSKEARNGQESAEVDRSSGTRNRARGWSGNVVQWYADERRGRGGPPSRTHANPTDCLTVEQNGKGTTPPGLPCVGPGCGSAPCLFFLGCSGSSVETTCHYNLRRLSARPVIQGARGAPMCSGAPLTAAASA